MRFENRLSRTNFEQWLAKFNRLAIFYKNLGNDTLNFSFDFVHYLHCLNYANN